MGRPGQTGRRAGRRAGRRRQAGNAAWTLGDSGVRWMREVKRNARLVDMGGRGFYAASRMVGSPSCQTSASA